SAADQRLSAFVARNIMRATVLKRLACGMGVAVVGVVAAAEAPSPAFTFQLPGYGNFGSVLAVDAQGNTYAAGHRFVPTSDFPVTDSAVERRPRNMFVLKLDPRGERFVWATYLGGTRGSTTPRGSAEGPSGIAVDAGGNVLVAGNTDTTDFPTLNALVASKTGTGIDGFLTKISADGSRFTFSTYLGGSFP